MRTSKTQMNVMIAVLVIMGLTTATWAAGGQGSGTDERFKQHIGQTPAVIDPEDALSAPTEPIQFSIDEDGVGLGNALTPVDADDISLAGIDPMGYILQTFDDDTLGGLIPSPPVGHHNAVLHPYDLGLRRNLQQAFIPLQTHKDEVNALSGGRDLFHLDGTLAGNAVVDDTPFIDRIGFPAGGEPVVLGGTRVGIGFSVDVEAQGAPGSAVAAVVGNPLKPSSHVFRNFAPGTNVLLYAPAMLAVADNEDVDAYENKPVAIPALAQADDFGLEDPVPGQIARPFTFFSVDNEAIGQNPAATGMANAVNTQAGSSEAAGDIFVGFGGGTNLLLIDQDQLGLHSGGFGDPADDLDAVALNIRISQSDLEQRINDAVQAFEDSIANQGSPHSGPGIDEPLLGEGEAVVLFSVEEGSIGKFGSAVDFEHRVDANSESADLFFSDLSGQNYLSFEATDLGLLETDELDALDTFRIPEPGTIGLLMAGGLLMARRRRN